MFHKSYSEFYFNFLLTIAEINMKNIILKFSNQILLLLFFSNFTQLRFPFKKINLVDEYLDFDEFYIPFKDFVLKLELFWFICSELTGILNLFACYIYTSVLIDWLLKTTFIEFSINFLFWLLIGSESLCKIFPCKNYRGLIWPLKNFNLGE